MPYLPNPDRRPGAPALIEVDGSGHPVSHVQEDPGCAMLLMAPVLLALWPPFYPLTAAAVLLTWMAADEIPAPPGPARYAVVAVPCLIVFWLVMRLDQRLGEWRPYRWIRHAARVLLPALLVNLLFRAEVGLPDEEPTPAQFVRDTFAHGRLLAATLVTMGVVEVIIWAGRWVRADWRRILVVLRLRSAKLSD